MKQLLVTLALLALPSLALASSIQFGQTSVTVKVGDTFTVPITISPDTAPGYTSSVSLQFPANLVQESNFTLDPAWLSLPQQGYDLVDNTNGLVTKSGGYPGGMVKPTAFGTLTFTATAVGSGVIVPDNKSFVLGADNQNTLNGGQQIDVTVVATSSPTAATDQSSCSWSDNIFVSWLLVFMPCDFVVWALVALGVVLLVLLTAFIGFLSR